MTDEPGIFTAPESGWYTYQDGGWRKISEEEARELVTADPPPAATTMSR